MYTQQYEYFAQLSTATRLNNVGLKPVSSLTISLKPVSVKSSMEYLGFLFRMIPRHFCTILLLMSFLKNVCLCHHVFYSIPWRCSLLPRSCWKDVGLLRSQ
jgi:hypothetical protein